MAPLSVFGWANYIDGGNVHVVPVSDLKTHVIDVTGECWCHPRIEREGLSSILVHNSSDGREKYERGERRAA